MDDVDRAPFTDQAAVEKKRYQREMEIWKLAEEIRKSKEQQKRLEEIIAKGQNGGADSTRSIEDGAEGTDPTTPPAVSTGDKEEVVVKDTAKPQADPQEDDLEPIEDVNKAPSTTFDPLDIAGLLNSLGGDKSIAPLPHLGFCDDGFVSMPDNSCCSDSLSNNMNTECGISSSAAASMAQEDMAEDTAAGQRVGGLLNFRPPHRDRRDDDAAYMELLFRRTKGGWGLNDLGNSNNDHNSRVQKKAEASIIGDVSLRVIIDSLLSATGTLTSLQQEQHQTDAALYDELSLKDTLENLDAEECSEPIAQPSSLGQATNKKDDVAGNSLRAQAA